MGVKPSGNEVPGADADSPIAGANKRSVWEIATEPYPEAHFATYPTALVEPCIRAGTSEKGVCPACGAPWTRVVERTPAPRGVPTPKQAALILSGTIGGITNGAGWRKQPPASVQTLDWQPSCRCDAGEPVPATCLDPFFGAGTSGLVADRLNRDCIGIELNPAYAAMARARIAADNPLFVDVA